MFTLFILVNLAFARAAQIENKPSECVPDGRVHVRVAFVLHDLLIDLVCANALRAVTQAEGLKLK